MLDARIILGTKNALNQNSDKGGGKMYIKENLTLEEAEK